MQFEKKIHKVVICKKLSNLRKVHEFKIWKIYQLFFKTSQIRKVFKFGKIRTFVKKKLKRENPKTEKKKRWNPKKENPGPKHLDGGS